MELIELSDLASLECVLHARLQWPFLRLRTDGSFQARQQILRQRIWVLSQSLRQKEKVLDLEAWGRV
jgi:hypothetical protein